MATYSASMHRFQELFKVEVKSKPYEVYAGGPRAGVKGFPGTRKTFSNIPVWMVKAAKSAVLLIGFEGFRAAMRRVPLDTGKLATSGKLWLNNKIVGRGTYSGGSTTGIIANEDFYREDPFLVNQQDYTDLARGKVNVYIEFNRLDSKGQNLALWLHENLHEYGGASPAASKEGRGPKFVEGPMNEIIIPKLYNQVFTNIQNMVRKIDFGKI